MKPNKLKRHFETLHAIEIVETMFGDNFAKELQSIPLSNDTVSRRIDDIAEDVEQQLFGKLRDKLFSIQLDEATDSNKDAHFIAYVRFWDASDVPLRKGDHRAIALQCQNSMHTRGVREDLSYHSKPYFLIGVS
ncbi:SCAN domain-containing protein 3 [Trichonephila clavipes]|nr:SCAN domain-containing protein 3 [Trichonephila clavipes]